MSLNEKGCVNKKHRLHLRSDGVSGVTKKVINYNFSNKLILPV